MIDFASIRNQQPFELPAHLRLQALHDVKLIIPVGILSEGNKPLSELLLLDDDQTDIGVMESPDEPGKAVALIVFLKRDQEVELGRSSEVMVDGVIDNEPPFRLCETRQVIN